jgi:FHA domain/Bacterial regulatory proteins, luxR family
VPKPIGFPPHSLTASKLAVLRAAERQGAPFLAFKDDKGELRLEPLADLDRVTIGRSERNGLGLPWDPEVSRTHAQLELVGDDWTLVDDGLSRNGSFINGERVSGRRRLDDGDMMRIGRTPVLFRSPRAVSETTVVGDDAGLVRVSEAQLRVLVALCRPLAGNSGAAIPASNRQIAEELHLSQSGVKSHIRALFAKLGIDELPQYRKRMELAHRAFALGLVGRGDLEP